MQQVSRPRTDLVDEWLQAALALSIEIFSERPPSPFGNRETLGCLNGSIRGAMRRAWPAVHILRIKGWMTLAAPYPRRLERRTEAAEGLIPPEDAVDEAFRRSRPGERQKGGVPQKISILSAF